MDSDQKFFISMASIAATTVLVFTFLVGSCDRESTSNKRKHIAECVAHSKEPAACKQAFSI